MSEILLLPAPPEIKKSWFRQKAFLFAFMILLTGSASVLQAAFPQEALLANIALRDTGILTAYAPEKLIQEKNEVRVEVFVNRKKYGTSKLSDLGVKYSLSSPATETHFLFLPENAQETGTHASAEINLDYKTWNDYLNGVRKRFEKKAANPEITWDEQKGWIFHEGKIGVALNDARFEKNLETMVRDLERGKTPATLRLTTKANIKPLSSPEAKQKKELYASLLKLTEKPITLHLDKDIREIPLTADLVTLHETTAEVNFDGLKTVIQKISDEIYQAPSKVTIVGKNEVRPGIFKAKTEGEFKEGRRLNVDEALAQVKSSLEKQEYDITLKINEIPVAVYSELDKVEYELLSVGYSEYSKSHDQNRIYNVVTGLNRVNGTLVEPGKQISFNKSVGSINNDFKMGLAIFGTVARPSLGGGICQVATTFYRGILNLGVPITMRQNHSWDLSYYQVGGYGLDATIFPERGLDVKGVNDLPSHLFFYSYARPETMEAFVLVYGKGDGRKVTLTPENEVKPYKGAKTLKWTQTVEMSGGEVRENQIVSRYRS